MSLPRSTRAGVRATAGAVFVLVVLLALSCNSSGPSGPESYLIVENNSSVYTVYDVYLRETGTTTSWGLNQLNGDIGPGEHATVRFEPDTYDISIEADHPRSPLQIYAVAVPEDMALLAEITDNTMVVY